MKKVFGILLLLVTLFLTGCDSACVIETTDSSGTATVMNVSKTEDAEEVVKVISVLNGKKPLEDTDLGFRAVKCTAKISLELIGKGEAKGNKILFHMNSSLEADIEEQEAFADVNLSFSYAEKTGTSTTNEELSLKGTAYADALNAYVDGTLKYNGNSQTIKNRISMDEIKTIIGSMGNGSTLDLEDFDLPDLSTDAQVKAFVEKYGITISATSKNTITFKASVPLDEQADAEAAELFLEMDVNTMLPKSLKLNASDAVNELVGDSFSAKCLLELKFSYGDFKVKTLTDEQKSSYNVLPLDDFEFGL